MTITAAIARAPGADFEIAQVDLDAPRADEILVRIHGVGICHTDLVARDGQMVTPMPAVLGHEGAGVVEAVGAAITKVVPGDRVVLTFRSCGVCVMCIRGEPAYCMEFGPMNTSGTRTDGSCTTHAHGETLMGNFFGQSSFAEYAITYERNVVKVPDDVPLHLMGPLGCGVQTGAGAVMRSMACRPGSSIVILGGGSVGLSAVLGAVVQGCTSIVVSEPEAKRRALALEIGATHVIDPSTAGLTEALRAIDPLGMDYAFDTTGHPDVIQAAIAGLAKRGMLSMVGLPTSFDATIPLKLVAIIGMGVTIRGVIEGDSDPDVFIPDMIALYRAGRFPFDKLIKTYRLEDINKAIRDQKLGDVVKAVLLTDAVPK
jgi:aryl-alcohol dehydrogenase